LVGPPVGGAVYSTFGFRGPFIFVLLVIFLDFIGRIIIIERKNAILWGVDPTAVPSDNQKAQELSSSSGGSPGIPSDGSRHHSRGYLKPFQTRSQRKMVILIIVTPLPPQIKSKILR
jgi:hypothetical protein